MKPYFVELTRNVRVVPDGSEDHVIVQAETKLLVLSEDDDRILLERLDYSMRFWLDNNDPNWGDMGRPFKPTEMFQVNDVCFDTEMKEHVLISNGICALEHSNQEEYKVTHDGLDDCVFKPYEAIAIRCVGTEVVEAENVGTKAGNNSLVPICAWTYRGVNPDHLRKSDVTTEQFRRWMDACPTGRI